MQTSHSLSATPSLNICCNTALSSPRNLGCQTLEVRQEERGGGGRGGVSQPSVFPSQCNALSLSLCSEQNIDVYVLFSLNLQSSLGPIGTAGEPLKSATIFLCGISFPGQCMSNETSIKEIPSQCIALFSLNVHLILKAKSILPCETPSTQQFSFAFRFSRLYQDILKF